MSETAKQDSELDCTNKSRGVWLVKVPKYVAEAWAKVDNDAEAAKMRIEKLPGVKPNVTLSLSEAAVKAVESGSKSAIPKDYKLAVATMSAQTVAIFSQPIAGASGDAVEDSSGGAGKKKKKRLRSDSDDDFDDDDDEDDDDEDEAPSPKPKKGKLLLEGKVVQRAECRPVADLAYMKHKAELMRMSSKPQRTAKLLDKHVQNYKPVADHKHNIEFERLKKTEGKKSRGERDKVLEGLFAAFEKHQYYNVKDLQTITQQPVTYLKELLNEFCVYNKKPPHRNMWELKPEYRHYKPKEEEDDDDD